MVQEINFYDNTLYYEERGDLACWKLKGDFMKTYTSTEEMSKIKEYEYQQIETLTLPEIKKKKKIKIYNKNAHYIGIDKENGRIIYYDKSQYRICNKEGWNKTPIAYYLPCLHIDLLEKIVNCYDDKSMNFHIARFIHKNCNTPLIEIDVDYLSFIIGVYRDWLKGDRNG